ncbi:hypothetical protein HC174_16345 [Salinimicrobium sp. CDJ15-81-2]|nr:hypothetical protein [Salinimicrobium nanhaiense]
MTITPNASESEKKSPFYEVNEKFCREFEDFITRKDGKVNGRYNAWSYSISGKITKPKPWILHYRKSTYSGANLLLTSKYQNLLTLAEWTTSKTANENDYLIRKRTITDLIKIWLFKSYKKLEISDRYILISRTDNSTADRELMKKLKPLFQSKEIYKIKSKKDKLVIELRTDKHYFDIFKSISGV